MNRDKTQISYKQFVRKKNNVLIEIDNVDATLFEINNLYKINTYRSQNLFFIDILKMSDFYIHLREYLIIKCIKLYYEIRR